MKRFYPVKILSVPFLLFLFSNLSLRAQIYEGLAAEKRLNGAEILKVSETTGQIQYALFRETVAISEAQAMPYLRKVYRLPAAVQFRLIRSEKDELGFTHARYQQLIGEVPVLGGTLITHFRNGRLHSFNGEIYTSAKDAAAPVLSAGACFQIALDTIHAKDYKWESPEEEAFIREIKNDPSATWLPKGELIFCPQGLDFSHPDLYLCYRYAVYAAEPLTGENIYISAHSGKVVARENLIHTTNVTGNATTYYSGNQKISTDSTAPGSYRLRETVRGNGVTTLNLKKSTSYGAAVDFTDADNNWNNVNASKDEVATDCHWGAGKTYDYYKSKFNRNSYDNNNAKITSYVHYSSNYDNAFWNGVCMTYGDGNTFKPLTSLDVCGHEITHAVTSNSANLIYSYESGALNESFSDMFGNAIERYGKPAGYSWKIGEEITYSGNGLRNMQSPKILGQPRCYKSTNWYSGAGDNGGVHTNSGVQNWWFYLISEGGSGTNDLSNAYKVDSIGIVKAEQIAYRNLTVYLTATSQYADARFYSIRAAADLYGPCSKEVISVTNAWYACAVGNKYDSGYVKAGFIADTVVCNKSNTVKFTNLSSNAVSSKWYFGDGATSSSYNTTHTYSAYGAFTVKLVATSCFKNIRDSLIRTAYVKIDSTVDICNAVLMPQSGNDSTHKCTSFVYDDGGEGVYKQSNITNFRISTPGADSIRIRFYDFDYELNYDSLYIYKGKYPGGTKIGGYTGSTLPFLGANFTVAGSMITLRHVSDPFVVGRGFKLKYTAVKKPVTVKAYSDTTICYGSPVLLYATGKGGYYTDYSFNWKNIAYNDSVVVKLLVNTVYKVYLKDLCTQSADSAQVTVTVRSPLKLKAGRDTVICSGQSVTLNASATGGKTTAYQYIWNNGLPNGATQTVKPAVTTIYRVIVTDGCTPLNDTVFYTVKVKAPLKVKIITGDSNICYNKSASFAVSASGGDTAKYLFTWNNGLGTGPVKTISLTNSTKVKVILTDACSVLPATDSVMVNVSAQLKVDVNNDTTICRGSNILLSAKPTGGKTSGYTYTWNQGLPATASQNVSPAAATLYIVTLKDNCSDDATDSVMVSLLSPLDVKGLKDSVICVGQTVVLSTIAGGGRSSTYTYTWNNGLGGGPSHSVSPITTTVYRVILSDACTLLNDTALITITVNQPLKVKINTTDTLICYNKTAAMTAVATGGNGNYSYAWNNGLGNGSSKTATLTSSQWLKVVATDACTVKPAADSVYVKVRAPLTVVLNNDSTICKGSSMPVNATPAGGKASDYSYTWTNGLASVNSQNVSPAATIKYVLTLKDNCSDAAKDSILVTVLPALKITGLKDTTICYGGSATLKPAGTGGMATQYAYLWNKGLGTGKDQTVSPVSSTSYKVSLKDNCSSPYDSVTVNVFVKPALKITGTLSSKVICTGDSARLTLSFTGGIPAQYEWYVDGVRNFNYGVYLKPLADHHYLVRLKDNCSSDDTLGLDITVNPKPVIDFAADKLSVCRMDNVQFTNKSTGAVAYEWQFSATDKSLLTSPAYRYKTAGLFDVQLTGTSSSGCKTVLRKTAYISVTEMPISSFTTLPVSADILNPMVTFQNQSTNYTGFEWDFGDLTKDNTDPDPVHTYGDTGSYRVMLTTSNGPGCRDTLIQLVTIRDVYRLFVPDAITLNEDGLNDELQISGRGILRYRYSIYDRWGATVFTSDHKGEPFKGVGQDGSALPAGSYLLIMDIKDFEGKNHHLKQMLEIFR